MRSILPAALAAGLALLPAVASAQAGPPDPALVDEGRFLAVAGDCAGCHGADLSGGQPIESPIGAIYASNITPDGTGIGAWSLDDFEGVMRHGRGPDGLIYPAMPYTSYTGLTDGQVAALYAYLMLGVEPVENVPPETDLGFPFYRPLMAGWNLLFLDEGRASGAQPVVGAAEERGRMLVETLGHCTACHSPRGQLMQQLPDRHLAGGMIGGWWAPNITPDPTGIGDWPDAEVARFLKTGHAAQGIAAGEMATVVERSTSRMPDRDIDAIVSYLRAIPPVASERPEPLPLPGPVEVAALDAPPTADWRATVRHDTLDGAALYQSACASCHGRDGEGSADGAHPSLRLVTGQSATGANLVQVIAHGVNREVGEVHALMPGFRDAMTDAQIAATATYVRAAFGGVRSEIGADDVRTILAGGVGAPWLIENAPWLAAVGLGGGILVLGALIAWTVSRRHRHA